MDTLTPAERSERMSRIRGRGTGPERRVLQELQRTRFKFSQNLAELPGKPDFVFHRAKVALFVQGCFWHAHRCQEGRIPASNTAFWAEKLVRNGARDRRVAKRLRMSGWHVLTIWECKTRTDVGAAREVGRVLKFIRAMRDRGATK
jgi:DNA mismatch endonuclease (patch repair protein)